jgi:hypothetical protein
VIKKFDNDKDPLDWNGWSYVNSKPKVCIEDSRLEAKIPTNIFGNIDSDITVLFHTQDYNGNEDFSDKIITVGEGLLRINQESIGDSILKIDSSENPISKLMFQAEGNDINLDSLILSRKGTAVETDTGNVGLYHNNKNIATGKFIDNKVTLVFDKPILIKNGEMVSLDVRIDISENAIKSHVLGVEIESKNDVSIISQLPIIIESDIELKYIEGIPNQIIIDGAFADWIDIEPNTDPDNDVNNENIDLVDYRIATQDVDISFYMKVTGEMLGGCTVPFKSKASKSQADQPKPISTINNENNAKSNDLDPPPLPIVKGEDYSHIFIDSDNNRGTGVPIINIGADYLIQITGKYGEITSSNYYRYTGTDWNIFDKVHSACDDKQLEIQLNTRKLSIYNDFGLVFKTTAWDGKEDYSDIQLKEILTYTNH